VGAVFDGDACWFAMGMGQHGHHRLREVGIFESDGPLLDAKMFEVVGNGVNHPDFIIEANDMVKMSEFSDILHIRLGYAKSDFSAR
jgi:hypothetical protein